MTKYEINNFISWVKDSATNAGFGSSNIAKQLDCYEAGRLGTFPDSWLPAYNQYIRATSDEYKEYLRLRDIYEDTYTP